MPTAASARPLRPLLLVAAGAVLVRAVVFGGLELYADEAYYWLWSRAPAAGYYDHPPLVSWVAWLSSLLPGELGLRLLFLLCGGAAVVFSGLLARELSDDPRAPVVAALLAAAAPLLTLTGALALPDAPLEAAASCATWLIARARGRTWVLAGIPLGFALLAKYSAGLFAPILLLLCVVDADLRRDLRTPWPWLAALVASAIFLPCLLWNATHDWISLQFQLHHGFNKAGTLRSFGEYVAGQVFGAGPLAMLAGVAFLVRARKGPALRVAMATLVPLAVTTYSATHGLVEANWPALVYTSLCAAAAALVVGWSPRAVRWATGLSVALGLVVALVYGVVVRTSFGAKPSDPIVERFHGWREITSKIQAIAQSDDPYVIASNYQEAAELAWYAGWRRFGTTWARPSQFDLWRQPPRPGERVVVVSRAPVDEALRNRLGIGPIEETQQVEATLGGRRVRSLWVSIAHAPADASPAAQMR